MGEIRVTVFGGQPHLHCDKASRNNDIFPGEGGCMK